MTLDQIDRLVRQANPVPDLTALEPIDASVLDEQRRTDMQTHDRIIVDDEGEEPKRSRNLLIGIAAAVAIIIGALLLLRPLTEDLPVADQPTTTSAVETATAFVEAFRVNFDVDQAFSYLAANAEGLDGMEEERLFARFLQAIGSKTMLGSCEETKTSPTGTLVSCSFEEHSLRSDEMGLGPYGGSSYELTVVNGKVASFESNLSPGMFQDPNGFSKQVWEPFTQWVVETYPDDVSVMYEGTGWRITEESIPLWEQRSREYVEVVRERSARAVEVASSFVETFSAFKAETASFFLAPDADLSAFEWDGNTWQMYNRMMEAQGWKIFLDACVVESVGSTVVTCPFEFHALHSDEIGLGPFGGNSYDITVEAGKIVSASFYVDYIRNGFSKQVWEPFRQWIGDNHPDEATIMYKSFGPDLERVTDESIALWEQRSREYADTVLAG